MPQQYKPGLNAKEEILLADIADAYGFSGKYSDVVNLIVWGDRIVMAFSVGERRLFLKEWPSFIEFDYEFAFCLDLQTFTRQRGLPVPEILCTQEGRRIFEWQSRRFSLQEYVGTPYDPTRSEIQIENSAQVLGRLHDVVRSACIGGKPWRDDPFDISERALNDTRDRIAEGSLAARDRQETLEILARVSECFERAREKMNDLGWSELPIYPLHGDFCQFNCRFDHDVVVGIVDWDHARLGPRLLDIGHGINIGLGWRPSIDHYEDFRWPDARVLEPAQVKQWIRCYSQEGPTLSDQELALLPFVCLALWPQQSVDFPPESSEDVRGCRAVLDYMHHLHDQAESTMTELMG